MAWAANVTNLLRTGHSQTTASQQRPTISEMNARDIINLNDFIKNYLKPQNDLSNTK